MALLHQSLQFYCSGGINSSGKLSDKVEISDLITAVTTFNCVIPRLGNSAAIKGDNLVFFTGYEDNHPLEGTRFEIYNKTTDIWSTGVLNQKIVGASVISVNNTIYVAGGSINGVWSDKIWKLEF